MKKKRFGPYLLILALVILIVFIIGVRIGQRAEYTNKAVSAFILSITPKPTLVPSPRTFTKYVHKECRVSLIIPTSFSTKETSTSATLLENADKIILSCAPPISPLPTPASPEAQLKIGLVTYPAISDSNTHQFIIKNLKSGKQLSIQISKGLLPLIQSSIVFE